MVRLEKVVTSMTETARVAPLRRPVNTMVSRISSAACVPRFHGSLLRIRGSGIQSSAVYEVKRFWSAGHRMNDGTFLGLNDNPHKSGIMESEEAFEFKFYFLINFEKRILKQSFSS